MHENTLPIVEPAEFFMVWTKAGHAPRKTHVSRTSATAEAARLAAIYPGRKYVVLQAVTKLHVPARQPSAQAL